jgi:hypothetical protein
MKYVQRFLTFDLKMNTEKRQIQYKNLLFFFISLRNLPLNAKQRIIE